MGASRDSGVLEFSYRKISAVKQWKSLQGSQSKNLDFFEFPRVSIGAHPLTKKPEDSGYEIVQSVDENVISELPSLCGLRIAYLGQNEGFKLLLPNFIFKSNNLEFAMKCT